jgi:hypothetical protein
MTKLVPTYLVAVHLLVDTTGANPRSDVIAALEAHLDHPLGQVPAAGTIVDWAVAGEDLAGSFPDWPSAQQRRAASCR